MYGSQRYDSTMTVAGRPYPGPRPGPPSTVSIGPPLASITRHAYALTR